MIEFEGLSKWFGSGSVAAMDGLSLKIERGKFVTLLGPSGCGKTTLLRCLAGLEVPNAGSIRIEDRLVFCSKDGINVAPNKRHIGMVFQSYAIWPHMTVFQNVAFPMQVQRKTDIKARVEEVLSLVGLRELSGRMASNLSGGQQQRIAFARAIVADPTVLLLDEPLSNLDAELRRQMCGELRLLQQKIGATTVYVTHDQSEALALSDTIAVMRNGRFVEIGAPRDLYVQPSEIFTAQFLGAANLIEGIRTAASDHHVDTPLGLIECAYPIDSEKTAVFLRPENIRVLGNADSLPPSNLFAARVVSCFFAGNHTEMELMVECDAGPVTLRCTAPSTTMLECGADVRIHIDPDSIRSICLDGH